MTEDEVNLKVKEWLLRHSYHYKGILNTREVASNQRRLKQYTQSQYTRTTELIISKSQGYGQVPVPLPDGSRSILIDHQGFRDDIPDLLWVEAKGGGDNLSELLEGFIRLCVAIYWGGGNGFLAVPHAEYERLLEQKDFLRAVAHSVNDKGQMGLIDIERNKDIIL